MVLFATAPHQEGRSRRSSTEVAAIFSKEGLRLIPQSLSDGRLDGRTARRSDSRTALKRLDGVNPHQMRYICIKIKTPKAGSRHQHWITKRNWSRACKMCRIYASELEPKARHRNRRKSHLAQTRHIYIIIDIAKKTKIVRSIKMQTFDDAETTRSTYTI